MECVLKNDFFKVEVFFKWLKELGWVMIYVGRVVVVVVRLISMILIRIFKIVNLVVCCLFFFLLVFVIRLEKFLK